MRFVLRSKIHQATVTGGDVSYVGSIAIDRDLVDRAGLWVGEKVLIVSNTTGARLETYVLEAPAGSGVIEMRGAAALLVRAGEQIIIMGFELVDEPLTPTVILVDEENRFVRRLEGPG